jgi:hypothetical protein
VTAQAADAWCAGTPPQRRTVLVHVVLVVLLVLVVTAAAVVQKASGLAVMAAADLLLALLALPTALTARPAARGCPAPAWPNARRWRHGTA